LIWAISGCLSGRTPKTTQKTAQRAVKSHISKFSLCNVPAWRKLKNHLVIITFDFVLPVVRHAHFCASCAPRTRCVSCIASFLRVVLKCQSEGK